MAQVDLQGGGARGGTAGSLQGRGARSGDLGRVGWGQGSELRGTRDAAQRAPDTRCAHTSILSPAPLTPGDGVGRAARVCAESRRSLDYSSPEPRRAEQG